MFIGTDVKVQVMMCVCACVGMCVRMHMCVCQCVRVNEAELIVDCFSFVTLERDDNTPMRPHRAS